MDEKQTKLVETIVPTKQLLFKNAFKGNKSASIKAKCFECCGFDQIEAASCEIMTCPLIMVNPWRKSRVKRATKIES